MPRPVHKRSKEAQRSGKASRDREGGDGAVAPRRADWSARPELVWQGPVSEWRRSALDAGLVRCGDRSKT